MVRFDLPLLEKVEGTQLRIRDNDILTDFDLSSLQTYAGTVVVISHGLSVTSFADRTYRLEDGSATALDRSGHTAADALHPERGGSAPQGKRLS